MSGALVAGMLAVALLPAVLALGNARHYARARPRAAGDRPAPVSVLVPARNEQERIAATVRSVLRSEGVELELLVLDDASEDDTAGAAAAAAAGDARLRILRGEGPASGWNGKQFACSRLAAKARHSHLLFLDADVQVQPDAIARLVHELERREVDLLSGVPRQRTGTWLEHAVVPLIHFVLLGFLPMARMRRSGSPAYAAGCGQLMLARRQAYEQAGGHAAIRASRHDGLTLPRAFRASGRRTDLVDATDLAECRMYEGAVSVWRGFGKNAVEGMATPAAILPWTLLLLGGQVAPWVALAAIDAGALSMPALPVALAALSGTVTRTWMARRYGHQGLGVLLHPLGVVVLVAIQWWALANRALGRQVAWRGRLDAGVTS